LGVGVVGLLIQFVGVVGLALRRVVEITFGVVEITFDMAGNVVDVKIGELVLVSKQNVTVYVKPYHLGYI